MAGTNQGTDRELTATIVPHARDKAWADVTDEEIVEAVRLLQASDGEGVARSVDFALASPRAEQWPTQPPPANALLGLGLIPAFGEGAAPAGAVTRRLKKLAERGLVERVEMVRPMGAPGPPAWRVP